VERFHFISRRHFCREKGHCFVRGSLSEEEIVFLAREAREQNEKAIKMFSGWSCAVFALSMVGCGSGTAGSEGQTGGGTTSRLVAQTYDEQCAFCHGPDKEAGHCGDAFYRHKQPCGEYHSWQ
jgi:hypothetical protein